jgi:hypothetical protein
MKQFRLLTALMVIPLAATAQVSTSVTAGPLHGEAQAGPVPNGHTKDSDEAAGNDRAMSARAMTGRDDQARRDRDPNCTERSVTVESPNGSASSSASVSSSSNGSMVVAGGGSPGSRTTYGECGRTSKNEKPSQDGKDGEMK